MKKKLLLSGLIVGTVSLTIFSLVLVIGLISIINVLTSYETYYSASYGTLAVAIIETLIFIIALVLNSICIDTWNSETKFNKGKATIITAVVFNFICIVLLFITFFGTSSATLAFAIIIFLALIAANTLILIDLTSKPKKQNEEVVINNEQNKISTLEEQLQKLANLKSNGLINDEEYNVLKKEIINENLKK